LKKTVGSLLFLTATACLGQSLTGLCPRHIETPEYPVLAQQTRIMGKITLTVTIDADGRVQHIDAMPDEPNMKAFPLLQNSAIENMQHWTFTKPPFAPYTQRIVYDYEADTSLPPSGGPKALPRITKVIIDLPDHVKILMNDAII
jgi:Gram-negative bacterial TonB protein C-terminal